MKHLLFFTILSFIQFNTFGQEPIYLLKPSVEYLNFRKYSEGLASVESTSEGKGFIDKYGKVVIPFRYIGSSNFVGGLARVGRVESNGRAKFGFVDKTGKEVIPLIYDEITNFSDGLALAKLNGEQFFIDRNGSPSIILKDRIYIMVYDFEKGFSENLFNVSQTGSKPQYGYINKLGKLTIPYSFPYAGEFKNGLAIIYDGKKYGFIDKTGKVVIPSTFDFGKSFNEGMAIVTKNGKGGAIDIYGNTKIPFAYDDLTEFSEGLSSARLTLNNSEKWGFLDSNGKTVIPFKYDDVIKEMSFSEGLAAVKLNEKWGYINKNGKTVIDFIFDSAYGFHDGVAVVKLNGMQGVIKNPLPNK